MTFEFITAPRVRYGGGVSSEVGALTRGLGCHALVVTGRSTDRAARILQHLQAAGVAVTRASVEGEPTVEDAQRGALQAREAGCDIVVGIGGGSAIDAAKAIAALATNDDDPFEYLEVVGRGQPLRHGPLPVVAVPTTAGTGSEVTKNAVLTVTSLAVKVSLRSPLMLPRVAVVDPDLTLDLPSELTASTGLDALTQLIEPFLSSKATPVTDALAVEGLPRAATSLLRAVRHGHDREARASMSYASLLGGMCLANAGLGAVHGFAGTLGGLLGAPHGALCAALLPHVLATNLVAVESRAPSHPVRARFEALGPLLTGHASATAPDAIAWVRGLVEACEIPTLSSFGLNTADISRVVEQAARSSSMKGNPIALTDVELTAVLEAAM